MKVREFDAVQAAQSYQSAVAALSAGSRAQQGLYGLSVRLWPTQIKPPLAAGLIPPSVRSSG